VKYQCSLSVGGAKGEVGVVVVVGLSLAGEGGVGVGRGAVVHRLLLLLLRQ